MIPVKESDQRSSGATGATSLGAADLKNASTDVARALDSLFEDPRFQASPRNKQFLRFIVEEVLAGRGTRIKAYTIAVDVFGRPSNFDGAIDPIVRIEASRLRTALSNYYDIPGLSAKVRISLPRGGYVPQFEIMPSAKDTSGLTQRGGACETIASPVEVSPAKRPPAPFRGIAEQRISGSSSLWDRLTAQLARSFRRKNVNPVPVLFVSQVEALTSDAQTSLLARTLTQSLISALGQFDGIAVSTEREGVTEILAASPERQGYQLASEVRLHQDTVCLWWSLVDMRTSHILQSLLIEAESWRSPSSPMIETDIAEKVAAAIAHREGLIGSALARAVGDSLQAGYPAVLRAREYVRNLDASSFATTRSILEKTVRLIPDYAEAWAYLAYMYADETRHVYAKSGSAAQSIELARTAASRALQLAPYSALSHLAAMVTEFQAGDDEAFARAAEIVLRLAPSDPKVLVLAGNRFWAIGRRERGLALIRRGVSLAQIPGPMAPLILAFDHYVEDRFHEALSILTSMGQNVYLVPMLCAACYGQLGDYNAAQEQIRQLKRIRPDCARELRGTFAGLRLQEPVVDAITDGLNKAGFFLSD